MKTIKRLMRLLALILMVLLASIMPVPLTFYRKDNLPKFPIEQVDNQEEEDDQEDIMEIF